MYLIKNTLTMPVSTDVTVRWMVFCVNLTNRTYFEMKTKYGHISEFLHRLEPYMYTQTFKYRCNFIHT